MVMHEGRGGEGARLEAQQARAAAESCSFSSISLARIFCWMLARIPRRRLPAGRSYRRGEIRDAACQTASAAILVEAECQPLNLPAWRGNTLPCRRPWPRYARYFFGAQTKVARAGSSSGQLSSFQ